MIRYVISSKISSMKKFAILTIGPYGCNERGLLLVIIILIVVLIDNCVHCTKDGRVVGLDFNI